MADTQDIPRTPCQLYLISPLETGGDFPARLEKALEADRASGLVTAFQFRVKGLDQHQAARLASPLQEICAAHEVGFIVNDDVALARRIQADGIHLGQQDASPRDAREELGQDVQIGVTCHDSRHLAMEAGEQGADYVAFGAFYPSETKQSDHRPEPEILEWWQGMFELPCVAIGGITPGNCAPLVKAGADFLAVCGAIWNGDEQAAIAEFARAMRQAQ